MTIITVFASFTKCQIRFPLKNHEIAMGTCIDVLCLTTGCYENLFQRALKRASQNVKVGFHCFKNQWEPELTFCDLH